MKKSVASIALLDIRERGICIDVNSELEVDPGTKIRGLVRTGMKNDQT